MQGTYLGPNFNNQTITSFLNSIQAPFRTLEDPALFAELAALLDQGKVVGWFKDAWSLGLAPWGLAQFSGTLAIARCKPQ